MRIHFLALAAALGLTGCAVQLQVPETQIVMFSGAGNLVDPTGNVSCKPAPAPCHGRHTLFRPYRELQGDAAKEYRARVIADAKARAPIVDGKRRLLLYVHGGLNTQRGTVSRAAGLAPYIPPGVTHPIFVNWQSSFFSTYWDHAVHLRQGQYWKRGGWPLTPIWVGSDMVRSVGHAPIDYFYEVKTVYDTFKGSALSQQIDAAQQDTPPVPHIRHGRDLRSKPRKAFDVAMQVVFAPPKLVTAPLVDGFGTGAWNSMQHRTTALFQSDAEFASPGSAPDDRRGGLSIFLRELAEMIKDDGGSNQWSVTLVGHSMGALVVNRMLDGYADLPVDRIVYLASAASIDDYKRTALAYLQQHEKTEMYHVTLERRAEAFERFAVDVVPRGTLLVWVDNLLSKPSAILERRVGRYSNLMRDIHDTPVDVAPRVYVMNFDFGPSVRKTQPQRHGAAGAIEFWRTECLFTPGDGYPDDCVIPERDVDESAKVGRAMAR